jgi:hypothetical protein
MLYAAWHPHPDQAGPPPLPHLIPALPPPQSMSCALWHLQHSPATSRATLCSHTSHLPMHNTSLLLPSPPPGPRTGQPDQDQPLGAVHRRQLHTVFTCDQGEAASCMIAPGYPAAAPHALPAQLAARHLSMTNTWGCLVSCLLGALPSGSSAFWELCLLGALPSGSSAFWELCLLGALPSGSSALERPCWMPPSACHLRT